MKRRGWWFLGAIWLLAAGCADPGRRALEESDFYRENLGQLQAANRPAGFSFNREELWTGTVREIQPGAIFLKDADCLFPNCRPSGNIPRNHFFFDAPPGLQTGDRVAFIAVHGLKQEHRIDPARIVLLKPEENGCRVVPLE